ncbi:hypothetical protein Tco_0850958 [Tanacetum coccineum]
MPCVLCVDGSCPSDCPALDLFPSEELYKEQGMVLAEKVMMAVGFKTEFIKDCLRSAKYLAEEKKVLAEIKEANAKSKELNEAIKAQHKIHERLVKDIDNAAVDLNSPTRFHDFQDFRKCTTVMDDDETSRGD